VYRKNGIIKVNPRYDGTQATAVNPLRPQRLIDYYKKSTAILNIQSQRGCPFTCCYCTYPFIDGPRGRSRDPAEFVDEVEELRRAGIRYLFITDSVFNTSNDHVARICEELLRRRVDVSWSCFLRPCDMSKDLWLLMARAGLKHVEFGSDSFCDEVLRNYGKNFTFDDIAHTSEHARAAKVRYAHFLIIGGPGETELTIKKSFEHSQRLRHTIVFAYIGMRIYPGTSLCARAIAQKVITGETDLVRPEFYLAPGLDIERINALLSRFTKGTPQWLYDEPEVQAGKIMQTLRNMGVEGPLWEFLIK
jgi:radical SAM superfamily enzyme YgiQ (UPF0313 family)